MKCIVTDEPEGKFVALFADGSGGDLFVRRDIVYNADGAPVDDLFDMGYLWWIPLPEDFVLFYEHE